MARLWLLTDGKFREDLLWDGRCIPTKRIVFANPCIPIFQEGDWPIRDMFVTILAAGAVRTNRSLTKLHETQGRDLLLVANVGWFWHATPCTDDDSTSIRLGGSRWRWFGGGGNLWSFEVTLVLGNGWSGCEP